MKTNLSDSPSFNNSEKQNVPQPRAEQLPNVIELAIKNRREFLKFFGFNAALSALGLGSASGLLAACQTNRRDMLFPHIQPSQRDDLVLAEGLQAKVLLSWGDLIGPQLSFGNNNDYTAFIPFDGKNPNNGMMMINHEFVNPLFVSGYAKDSIKSKTIEQVVTEQKSVGVSLVRFHKKGNEWLFDLQHPLNRRLDARTQIPFSRGIKISGQSQAMGTLANCAGGVTPWNTFLTCEENYDQFYGEWSFAPKKEGKKSRIRPVHTYPGTDLSWSLYFSNPPTHYGWVVEIQPLTGEAKKLVSLGRFAHEGATCRLAKDGRCVVYMGDDAANECVYKFIADRPGSLDEGTLYVASLEKGRWLSLDYNSDPRFKNYFRDPIDLLTRVREAAQILEATPLDRPEDIEINPLTGDLIVALTNNPLKNNPHGSLLKIIEKDNDPLSLEFSSSTWKSGGPENGMSCPDNLVFDRSGNLWFTNDISDERMNKPPYESFKNNGLFFIPGRGSQAGKVFQMASGPTDSELTGPCFTPDGETLILSVQHPGEQTKDLKKPTSRWPTGHLPKSSVISLSGPTLRRLVDYSGD